MDINSGSGQSIFLAFIGSVFAMFAAVAGHLYRLINDLTKLVTHVETKVDTSITPQMTTLREEISRRLTDMAQEMQGLRLSRFQIAEQMVTRAELDKQIDRVLDEFHRMRQRGVADGN